MRDMCNTGLFDGDQWSSDLVIVDIITELTHIVIHVVACFL